MPKNPFVPLPYEMRRKIVIGIKIVQTSKSSIIRTRASTETIDSVSGDGHCEFLYLTYLHILLCVTCHVAGSLDTSDLTLP